MHRPHAMRRLGRYVFWGNNLTDDGVGRLAFLALRLALFWPISVVMSLILGAISLRRPVNVLIMRCNRSKISFVIEDLEYELRIQSYDRRVRSNTRTPVNIAVLDTMSPNEALTALYGRVIRLYTARNWLLMPLFRYVIPVARVRRAYMPNKNPQRIPIWASEQPVTRFSISELTRFKELCDSLGLSIHQPYVCASCASRAYYEMLEARDHPTPEDIDDVQYLPSEDDFIEGVLGGVEAQLPIIRMGRHVPALSERFASRVVDYALQANDLDDLLLAAHCRFLVSGATGIWWLAAMFNVPVVITDMYSLSHTSAGPHDRITLLLPVDRMSGARLPISWIIGHREWALDRELLNAVSIRHSSPREIAEVVREMTSQDTRLGVHDEGDTDRRRRYEQLIAVLPRWRARRDCHVGTAFLRDHEDLIR